MDVRNLKGDAMADYRAFARATKNQAVVRRAKTMSKVVLMTKVNSWKSSTMLALSRRSRTSNSCFMHKAAKTH